MRSGFSMLSPAAAPLLLEGKIAQEFEAVEIKDRETHQIWNLEGKYEKFMNYLPSTMLLAYIAQLIMTAVMIVHFHSLGEAGYKFYVTSLAMVAWQHFANIVLFFAMFGVPSKWDVSATRRDMPLYDFFFYEGWCGQSKYNDRVKTLMFGCVFGALCPIAFYMHWSHWEFAREGFLSGIKRRLGQFVEYMEFMDKRKEWEQSDLEWREGASDPQLFRYLTNPSVFLIIWNAPYTFFQFLIFSAATINLSTDLIGGSLIVSLFVAFANIVLVLFFISPTPHWSWFFLSFFALLFDFLMIILTALVHPKYRPMNAYMSAISWIWTWSAIFTSFWIIYWWIQRVQKRLVRAAHVGPRYANLQKYFTLLMGTFFTLVYAGLGIYRTFSWIVEFEYASNKMRLRPAGLFAKIFGWIMLPKKDPVHAQRNLTKLSDFDLRVLVANVVVMPYLQELSEEETEATKSLAMFQLETVEDIALGNELPQTSIFYRSRFMTSHYNNPHIITQDKINPFALIRRRLTEDVLGRDEETVVGLVYKQLMLNVLAVCVVAYLLTRLYCWFFFSYTVSSFVYALVKDDMMQTWTNRDLILMIFLSIQCLSLVGIAYFAIKSWKVWKTSILLTSHVSRSIIDVESGGAIVAKMISLYNNVVQDGGTANVLKDFAVEDIAKLIHAYVGYSITEDYLDEFRLLERQAVEF